jgi:bifunctional DNase/RNase
MMEPPTKPDSPIAMEIRALVMDPVSKMPVVILHDEMHNLFLPIWIGVCEANAIALELEKVKTPRPMTHDLVSRILTTARLTVDHIHIHTLADNVFHAAIHLAHADGERHQIDARPSDALAVALRAKARVIVSPEVLEKAVIEEGSREESMRLILEKLRPEDMGEYEM